MSIINTYMMRMTRTIRLVININKYIYIINVMSIKVDWPRNKEVIIKGFVLYDSDKHGIH